jgi:cellobiose-specific phosphotransferase system component IIB
MVSSRGVSTSITRENVKKERQKLQIKEKFEEISEDDLCNLVNEIQTNVKLNRLND